MSNETPDAVAPIVTPAPSTPIAEREDGPGFWRRFAQRAADVGLSLGNAWASARVGVGSRGSRADRQRARR